MNVFPLWLIIQFQQYFVRIYCKIGFEFCVCQASTLFSTWTAMIVIYFSEQLDRGAFRDWIDFFALWSYRSFRILSAVWTRWLRKTSRGTRHLQNSWKTSVHCRELPVSILEIYFDVDIHCPSNFFIRILFFRIWKLFQPCLSNLDILLRDGSPCWTQNWTFICLNDL